MLKPFILTACLISLVVVAHSQDGKKDSAALVSDTTMGLSIDTTLDYDELLSDLDVFLDSLLAPRSYVLVSVSGGQGYFKYVRRNPLRTVDEKKFIWSPAFAYYDKGGFGINLTSYSIRDSVKFNSYQLSVTPSFDYIKDRHLATGVSLTHYFTKKVLPFYTSPLENEVNGYFLWRKSWLQPGIMANYGWGSKTSYSRKDSIFHTVVLSAITNHLIRDSDTATIFRSTKRSIVDFSAAFSLRHDFYWLDIFCKKDFIRFSPLVSLYAGTQKFGFNQTSGAVGPLRAVTLVSNSQDVSLKQEFQLLSLCLYLRGEYSVGKFFIQPQLLFDYYFPGEKNNLTATFSFNTGFMF